MTASTLSKGNAFRDLVASMLEAAGFVAETEVRESFKKVDVGGGAKTWMASLDTLSRRRIMAAPW